MIGRFGLAAAVALLVCGPALEEATATAGQSKRDYDAWAAQPRRYREVARFESYLRHANVAGVLPTYQILRTASDWAECRAAPFAVAPAALWPSIVNTLRLIRDGIEPTLGPVEALSGYRDRGLNACAGGAPGSAHALFYALDLTPLTSISRNEMIRRTCRLHARVGARWAWGLGFYAGMRFHVDTRRYRRWGSDGHSETSPCAAYDRRR